MYYCSVKDTPGCGAAWQKKDYTIFFQIWYLLSRTRQEKRACEDMKTPLYNKKKKASMIRMHNIFASQLPSQLLLLTKAG